MTGPEQMAGMERRGRYSGSSAAIKAVGLLEADSPHFAADSSALSSRLVVPADIRHDVVRNMESFCLSVRKVDPKQALSFIIADKYLAAQAQFYSDAFERYGVDPHAGRILEIGSGYGFFLAHAKSVLGWNISGIEPGKDDFSGRDQIAARVLAANGVDAERLICCAGEELCFPDSTFDAVISNDVLEHVADPEAVIRQSARVLKPGGLLAFNIPNYRWIYEGHYNIPWLPALTKPLARQYVRMLGRDESFLQALNFLTCRVLHDMLKGVPELQLLQPLDHGCVDFLSLRIEAYLDAHPRSRRIKLFRVLHRLSNVPWFKTAMAHFARVTGIYHELHVIARKR